MPPTLPVAHMFMPPLCLLVASCSLSGEPAPEDKPPAETAEAVPEPVESSSEIEGEWDVVSFDGHEPKRLTGVIRAAYADFDPRGVGLRIECNYSGRAGRVRNGRWVPEDDDAVQTAMGCGPERETRESAFFDFFDGTPSVAWIGKHRLRLELGGAELILEKPEVRRQVYLPSLAELQGEWAAMGVTRFHEEGGYSGIGLSEDHPKIVISGNRLTLPACPQYSLTFDYAEGGVLRKTGGKEVSETPADCPALDAVRHGTSLPVPASLLMVLHGNPRAEKTGEGDIALFSGRFGVPLTQDCEMLHQSEDHSRQWSEPC